MRDGWIPRGWISTNDSHVSSSISPSQLPRFRTEPAKPLDELGGTFTHILDSRLDIEDKAQTTSIKALANTLISSQVNVPKTRNTYCKGRTCKKHTQHKVTQYKAGKVGFPPLPPTTPGPS